MTLFQDRKPVGQATQVERLPDAGTTRRHLLQVMGLTALGCLLPAPSRAVELASAWRPTTSAGQAGDESLRTLALVNTHTGESLTSTFWQNGRYDLRALARIDHILRDHRTDQVKTIDTRLLDLLARLTNRLGEHEPIQIVSGYRSPATNETLRRHGQGVAKHSLHTVGKAIDLKIPGVSLSRLRRVAIDLRAGGVGYYPRSGFIHLDVGDVRFW